MLIPNFIPAVRSRAFQSATTPRSAKIQNVWVDHNIKVNGQTGMRIHVSAIVSGCTNVKCSAVVFFSFKGGDRLKDYNGSYVASDGSVSVTQGLNASYETSEFEDIQLFIPYTELHMVEKGSYNLEFDVHIHHSGNQCLTRTQKVNFTLTY